MALGLPEPAGVPALPGFGGFLTRRRGEGGGRRVEKRGVRFEEWGDGAVWRHTAYRRRWRVKEELRL